VNRVVLDYSQEILAHETGLARVADLKGRPNHPGRFNKDISLHEFILENAEAVAAEMAVAQYFGFHHFIPTKNTFKNASDVGVNLEVKWTKYDNGSLIINKTDRDSDVAILVTGRSPVYHLAGWIPIKMARVPHFHHRLQDNYWVTQRDLFPISDLRGSSYGSSI
jgi:hypothetical protein